MSFRMSIVWIIFVIYICPSQGKHEGSNHTDSIKLVDWVTTDTKDYLLIAAFILLVSLGKLTYHKLEWLASYIPESLLLIFFGVAAGAIYKYSLSITTPIHLTSNLFFLVLLPPIVLDSAFRMYNRTFGEIFGIVLIMAILGTVFCFFLIAFSLYGLEIVGAMGVLRPTNESIMSLLLFSSFIVAVDPVAVLAIFKDIGVDKELYYMIFGESLLNDAVTVVLYEIIKAFIVLRDKTIEPMHVILGILSFLTVSCGGLMIGLVIGVLSSALSRVESHSNVHCITIVFSAYLSYLLANSLKWSGIISLIACGIVQASYAFRNIELSTLSTLKELVELLAGISEAIIFVYLGLELFMNDLVWNVGFQIWAVVMCLVSRFIVLLVLIICINYVRVDQRKISWTEFFVATYGGLRGAVAFSLAALIETGLIDKDNLSEDERIRNLFTTTTLIIIFFTVGVMGTTMKPLAKFLNVKTEKKETLSIYNELNCAIMDNVMSGIETITLLRGRNRFRMLVADLDNKYIRPFLVNDPHDNSSFKILKRYQQITLALHYASINKEGIEQHLADVPRSLWPKSPRHASKVSRHRRISSISLASPRKISRTIFDPMMDEAKFTSLLELAHCNRLKDMIHRKGSTGISPTEITSDCGTIAFSPKQLNKAFTFLANSNLGYIDDEPENELQTIAVTQI